MTATISEILSIPEFQPFKGAKVSRLHPSSPKPDMHWYFEGLSKRIVDVWGRSFGDTDRIQHGIAAPMFYESCGNKTWRSEASLLRSKLSNSCGLQLSVAKWGRGQHVQNPNWPLPDLRYLLQRLGERPETRGGKGDLAIGKFCVDLKLNTLISLNHTHRWIHQCKMTLCCSWVCSQSSCVQWNEVQSSNIFVQLQCCIGKIGSVGRSCCSHKYHPAQCTVCGFYLCSACDRKGLFRGLVMACPGFAFCGGLSFF